MKEFLTRELKDKYPLEEERSTLSYSEDVNEAALTDVWLENRTSYIYKVGVLTAIDSNKCDWVHILIATQRGDKSIPEVKGSFYFSRGENDDIGRVLMRAYSCLNNIHPVFDAD